MTRLPAIIEYSKFKRLRRNLELRHPNKESPVVFVLKENSKTITLGMEGEGREVKTFVEKFDYSNDPATEHPDYTDYQTSLSGHMGEAYVPGVLNKKTHDFGDNSTWQYGTNNSMYIYEPLPGKIIYPDMFIAKFHKDDILPNGGNLTIALWESFGQVPCPDVGTYVGVISSSGLNEVTLSDVSDVQAGDRFMVLNSSLSGSLGMQYEMVTVSSKTGNSVSLSDGFEISPPAPNDVVILYKPTPYKEVLFNPLAGQNEGFKKVYPNKYDPQHNDVWYYLIPNPDPATQAERPYVPIYKATVFNFYSVAELRDQSKNLILSDGIIESVTSYKDQGLKMGLSHELKERIEIYMSNHQPITKGGIASLAVLIFKSNPSY